MTERRPGRKGSGGRNGDAWREQGYKTGQCWNEWIATLDVNA